ncbi:metal ABC transporter ATP-binding protein [Luteipulveratus sp. YIM 133132]|uniref:metal ABC transporter ATP-binding protein n=1 Tax=Luteipulveratus flavus TaxID=3031728 RepID=UPI0023AE8039|nr:metal ABC transporter ATP-binding protein [Luteipulveratus sp. YIM 133132]MDE9367549.1 metal ABC transporter ATP-binding protein [Luteipulveratus sp. YIM 133132]
MSGSSSGSGILQLQGASFGYADRAVVRGVDLDVEPGEVVALLGPNGSGKSTLVRGLLGLNEHLGGSVRLFGTEVERLRDRYRLGYVPQRHTLSASVRATVEEIVAIGRLPHQGWFARRSRADQQIVRESLELVGLSDRAQEDVSTLSGGQQRRVLIARALAAQPDVLIMDEPTAGIDEASQYVLADVLHRLVARGTTMLIVTHELAALRDVVSRIVVLTSGRVIFDGTPAAYAERRAADELAHTHGGHHHDDELPACRPTPTGAHGPVDHLGAPDA